MTADAVIFGIVLLILVVLATALPYLQGRNRVSDNDTASAEALQDQLTQVINAVHDLDFDFDTGKVPESDYVEQRKFLIGRGVSLLIRLDEALVNQTALDEQIEVLIARYRQQNA